MLAEWLLKNEIAKSVATNLADLLSPLKSEAGSLAQALKGGVAASICLQRLGEGLTFIGGSPMAPANFRWPPR